MTGWPEPRAGCGLEMDPGDVPVGILAMMPDQPAYIRVLGALSTTGFSDETEHSLVGSMPLSAAGRLLPGQTVQQFDITATQFAKGGRCSGDRPRRRPGHAPPHLR